MLRKGFGAELACCRSVYYGPSKPHTRQGSGQSDWGSVRTVAAGYHWFADWEEHDDLFRRTHSLHWDF